MIFALYIVWRWGETETEIEMKMKILAVWGSKDKAKNSSDRREIILSTSTHFSSFQTWREKEKTPTLRQLDLISFDLEFI